MLGTWYMYHVIERYKQVIRRDIYDYKYNYSYFLVTCTLGEPEIYFQIKFLLSWLIGILVDCVSKLIKWKYSKKIKWLSYKYYLEKGKKMLTQKKNNLSIR